MASKKGSAAGKGSVSKKGSAIKKKSAPKGKKAEQKKEDIVLHHEEGRLIIEMEKNHTLGNLIRKSLWEVGAEAGYERGHPYIGKSRLVIRSKDPKKDLNRAITKIKNDLREFKTEFQRLSKQKVSK